MLVEADSRSWEGLACRASSLHSGPCQSAAQRACCTGSRAPALRCSLQGRPSLRQQVMGRLGLQSFICSLQGWIPVAAVSGGLALGPPH